MSSTPFRAAFCALGLAFAMTVLLIVPNPNKIRNALRAQREKPLLPHERMLLAANAEKGKTQEVESAEDEVRPTRRSIRSERLMASSEPIAKPAAAPVEEPSVALFAEPSESKPEPVVSESKMVAEQTAPVQPDVNIVENKKPVQVASADPSAPLGLMAPAFPAAEEPASAASTIPPSAITAAKPAPPPVPKELPLTAVAPSGDSSVNITVPDPIQQTSRSMASAPVTPQVFPEEKPEVTENNALDQYLATNGASVRPGVFPRTWTFQFEETPLPVVLKLLGTQSGSAIIVTPDVEGTFSGQFTDADPSQVLAMIIKAHRFTVNRRGSYLLIGVRAESSVRPSVK